MGFRGIKSGLTGTLNIIGQLSLGLYRQIIDKFMSACSLIFDGVDEYILLDSNLRNTTSGVGAKFSFLYSLRRLSTGMPNMIHSRNRTSGAQRSFSVTFDSSNHIAVTIAADGTATFQTTYVTTNTFSSTVIFYHIGIVIDTSQAVDADKVKILVNGVEEAKSTAGSGTTGINLNTAIEVIGTEDTLINFSDMAFNTHGQITKAITLTEYQTWENGGEPLKISNVFAGNVLLEDYPQDATFGGGVWTYPSGSVSVNMEVEDQDCSDNPY